MFTTAAYATRLKARRRPADERAAFPNRFDGMTWRAPRTPCGRAEKRRLCLPARKLLLTVAVLGATASIAGLGTFATFTSSTSASHTVSSGTVTIALGATGASTNRLNVDATAIAPGDMIQRSVDLINQGTLNLASVTVTTQATTSSVLDTDATNGLQMVIDKCSQAWTEAGPPYTYTCGGSTSTVLSSRAVIQSGVSLSNLSSLTAGNTDHLRVTLTFPSGAGNSFQNKSSTIQYTFTGTQRAATDK
jgi:predicted ribosomally synthesized peptide with SipW-like signal peptide